MGRYKPGVQYTHETVNGITYAREVGTNEKFEIGRNYELGQVYGVPVNDLEPFIGLLEMAKHNEQLQQELDRLRTFYYLAKSENTNSVMYHPV